jgi:hypothetical protein
MVYIVVRGGEKIESVAHESHARGLQILFAGLLTRELIEEAEGDSLRQFENHLPAP